MSPKLHCVNALRERRRLCRALHDRFTAESVSVGQDEDFEEYDRMERRAWYKLEGMQLGMLIKMFHVADEEDEDEDCWEAHYREEEE